MKKVLIIDDDTTFSYELETTLKDSYDVTSSVDAMTALSQVHTDTPNLVFLDIDILGDLDGLSVLKGIRESEYTKNIPVIVLTNLGSQRKEEFLSNGATEYILKEETNLEQMKDLADKYITDQPEVS